MKKRYSAFRQGSMKRRILSLLATVGWVHCLCALLISGCADSDSGAGREESDGTGTAVKHRVAEANVISSAGRPVHSVSVAIMGASVDGVSRCVVSLNGEWLFNNRPQGDFWRNKATGEGWQAIDVPGEPAMQGFGIEYDVEYGYRCRFKVPADFGGKKILIRFDGVYSYARVWVNGHFVRDHHGGFTSWDCDITPFVQAGEEAELTVGVTDRKDEISFGSAYAKHRIGGILRDVRLFCLPMDHICRLEVETDLDEQYVDAMLNVNVAGEFTEAASGIVRFELLDANSRAVEIVPDRVELSREKAETKVGIVVKEPSKWDAEHPYLYTLKVEWIVDGRSIESIVQHVGFREVEVEGNRLLVNGKAVKLRGACRHDIHPTLGRTTTRELDEQDARLAKEANLNFIRTSHYPPSKAFLEFCDRYGIYVEEESAVCFVRGKLIEGYYRSSHDDPQFTERYLGQLQEMISRDRNHPCVIIWSLGNESDWGLNLRKSCEVVRKSDPSRPIIFSWPDSVPQDEWGSAFDILSVHYPLYNGYRLREGFVVRGFQYGDIPVLFDEWAHVACYNLADLKLDPGVRDFWGQSIKRMWDNSYRADGCLGGAIWGMIDEAFMLEDGTSGYGLWGIIDVWRRRKPEFRHTKKAYSPVRIETTELETFEAGSELSIPIQNRFDHTNLNELRVDWRAGNESGKLSGPDVAPHHFGFLRLPVRRWRRGEKVQLSFRDSFGWLIDEYNITLGRRQETPAVTTPEEPLTTSDNDETVVVQGKCFSIELERQTGQIRSATWGGATILTGGPWLNLVVPLEAGYGKGDTFAYRSTDDLKWQAERIDWEITDKRVHVIAEGRAGEFELSWRMTVNGKGEILAAYQLKNRPEKIQQLGLVFRVGPEADKLSWERDALWSVYPAGHIGRARGTCFKKPGYAESIYRRRPKGPWASDCKDFNVWGKKGVGEGAALVSNDFRTGRDNIRFYRLEAGDRQAGVTVEDCGEVTARSEVMPDGAVCLVINNVSWWPNLGWGNYEGRLPERVHQMYTIRLCLSGPCE